MKNLHSVQTFCHAVRPLRVFAALSFALLVTPMAWAQLRYAGSDTAEPVVESAQIAFARGHAGYKLQIQASGTSSGLRELCSGRASIVGASRPIKTDEMQACASANVQYVELPIALDAVVVVVSVKNNWLKDLTLAELRTVFDPASAGKLISWKQVRANFPDMPIRTAGVGIKHGTFSFFLESIGLQSFIRSDFKDFNDHNGTAQFVSGDEGAIGFMGLASAQSLENQVQLVGLDLGAGVVKPGVDEMLTGKYDKLSRTIYLYVNPSLLAKNSATDKEFVKLLVTGTDKFVRFSNLLPLRPLQYQENIRRMASVQTTSPRK